MSGSVERMRLGTAEAQLVGWAPSSVNGLAVMLRRSMSACDGMGFWCVMGVVGTLEL